MNKKTLLSITALVVVVSGVVALSAYEAHVINVTAKIENALKVLPITNKLEFGTVFPQEYLAKIISITSSQSFCESDQTRVMSIDYEIVQKPKPIWPQSALCGQYFDSIEDARAYCHDSDPLDLDCCYPSMCAYLSKLPADTPADQAPYDDQGVPAFHDPNDPSSIAVGTINKIDDLQDDWKIDLPVPCFEGLCSQDWPAFVARHNPNANPGDYELPAELESEIFGCDLWVEVTRIY